MKGVQGHKARPTLWRLVVARLPSRVVFGHQSLIRGPLTEAALLRAAALADTWQCGSPM